MATTTGPCSIEECPRITTLRRGLCDTHYARLRRTGRTGLTSAQRKRQAYRKQDPAGRFWPRVIWTATDCWVWTASKTPNGYGTFWVDGTGVVAHRWAYQHTIGAIPPGLVLDHLCRIRACVNPLHLEAVTSFENARRARATRKAVAA